MTQVSTFLLLFTQEQVIVPIFLLGYFFYDRKVFFQALVLSLGSIALVAFLKHLFKVPLMPHLGEGWAFPSGHMFVACAFWGFLGFELRNKFIRMAIALLLIGIGFSLVYSNFHTPMDVIAAVLFAFIMILFYHWLLTSTILGHNKALLSLSVFTFSALLIYFIWPLKSIFYISLGALLGLSVGDFIGQLPRFNKSMSLLFEIPLCLIGIILIYLLAPFLGNPLIPKLFLLYFLIGFWIMVGAKLVKTLTKR